MFRFADNFSFNEPFDKFRYVKMLKISERVIKWSIKLLNCETQMSQYIEIHLVEADEANEMQSVLLRVLLHCRITIPCRVMGTKICFSILRTYESHSEQWISTRRSGSHDVTARRLRASPAIKTLKVPSILLDHGFKSHVLSAYLNENPDCAALPKR